MPVRPVDGILGPFMAADVFNLTCRVIGGKWGPVRPIDKRVGKNTPAKIIGTFVPISNYIFSAIYDNEVARLVT